MVENDDKDEDDKDNDNDDYNVTTMMMTSASVVDEVSRRWHRQWWMKTDAAGMDEDRQR